MRPAILRFVAVLALSISLISCAAKYSEYSKLTGTGSKTLMLSENVFRVRFDGDIFTSEERVVDFALLKCADVAMSHGFQYFIVVDEKAISQDRQYKTAEKTYATATQVGNVTTGSAVKTGGQTFTLTEVQAENTIVCFNEKPEGIAAAFNAHIVSRSIRGKYKIGRRRPSPSLYSEQPEPTPVYQPEAIPASAVEVPDQKVDQPMDLRASGVAPVENNPYPSQSSKAQQVDTTDSPELKWASFSELSNYTDIPLEQIGPDLLEDIELSLGLSDGAIFKIRCGKSMAPASHPLHKTTWVIVSWTENEQAKSHTFRFAPDGSMVHAD
jgi:hypothetical protein